MKCTALLLTLAVFGTLAAQTRDQLTPESAFVVAFSKKTIEVTSPSGDKRAMAWKDITQVSVRSTEEGPPKPDLFWQLHGTDDAGTIVFPSGAIGANALIEAMQARLKGFDNNTLVVAIGSSTNQTFVLWEAAPKP
ncbi:MAG TPA: hypothetical protein VJ826_03085 [Candidatus Polarisedimenticolaceae bacterium]|nr:hypothetical protein [Candidatus Polarisedimenticolaceae bacterium]